MKIAVTYENGEVFQHFGHTETFKIYEVENGSIVNAQVIPTEGSGHGALADFLAEKQVEILICGGIGAGAKKRFGRSGDHVVRRRNGNRRRSRTLASERDTAL